MSMSISVTAIDGTPLISFFGRVAHYFKESNQILVTYDRKLQSERDLEKLSTLLHGECEFDMNEKEFVIDSGWADEDTCGGTSYQVNAVKCLTDRNIYGQSISNIEILLFDVSSVKEW